MEEALSVLKDIKVVIDSAVVLVEHPGDGADKKKKVIQIVEDFMKQNGIILPIPNGIMEWLIGEAVDFVVRWLNDNLWKKADKDKK
jgi:hypothetical protein